MEKEESKEVVYFMYTSKHVKIGISKSLKRRVSQVQTGCPTAIIKVEYFETSNRKQSKEIEKALHKEFLSTNTFGEWFFLQEHINFKKRTFQVLSRYRDFKTITFFDKKKDYIKEVSENINKKINAIQSSTNSISEKISQLSKYQNILNNDDRNRLYLVHSRQSLLCQCEYFIKKNIELARRTQSRIKNELENQKIIMFKDSLTNEEKDILGVRKLETEKINNEIVDIKKNILSSNNKENKILEDKLKENKVFVPDENKVNKVMMKYAFIL